jgi:hypothetical protein
MRRFVRAAIALPLLLLPGCDLGAPAGAPAPGPVLVGGGGGGGPLLDPAPAVPPDRLPGERLSSAACPVDFAGELAAAIATVEDRPAHDALEVQRWQIDRLSGAASESARRSAISRLQVLAQRLGAAGEIDGDLAVRIADLAACYLL